LTVIFAVRRFLCRFWRPDYLSLDRLNQRGQISGNFADLLFSTK
jgi:hypothetical protein